MRAVYLAAEPITWFVLVPLAICSLLTGLVQSLVSTWGLLQHYWVVFKLVVTVIAAFVLLLYTETVGHLADIAAQPTAGLGQLQGPSFVLHSSLALVLLLAAAVLSVYKPKGRTRRGWRKQNELRAASPS